MSPARLSCPWRRRQEGAATLVVVMVLFFIVSLVAAYTSRNMIFEQKTSANQYRSTQALAAAEAGVEWALVMLNGGRLDDDCALNAAAPRSFRARYLNFTLDPATLRETGFIELNPGHIGNLPTCVMEGIALTCKCPFAADLDPAAIGNGPQPAFRVRLTTNDQPTLNNINPALPGVIRIQARGCTRLDLAAGGCLDWAGGNAGSGDGQAEVTILAALRSGLATPPAAPLTARGAISVAAAPAVAVVNQDVGTAGVTVQTGVAAPALIAPTSLPGTPGEFSVIGADTTLGNIATGDRMFVAFFGMRRAVYRQQPGVVACANPCNAAAVTALLNAHPNHMIWVDGDLTVDGDLGIAAVPGPPSVPAVPVLLVVTGDVQVTADATITGLVYLAKADAELDRGAFTAALSGALVAEGALNIVGNGNLTLTYDAEVLNRLRTSYGSYVRVPGTWRDWN